MRHFLLILVPGIGLIRRGRPGRGIAFFFLFAFLVNLYLMSSWLMSGSTLAVLSLAGAGIIWLWNARDTLRTPPEEEEGPGSEDSAAPAADRPAEAPSSDPQPQQPEPQTEK